MNSSVTAYNKTKLLGTINFTIKRHTFMYFIVIDLLFFPYVPFFVMPMSLPFVVAALFLGTESPCHNAISLLYLFSVCVVISVIAGLIFYGDESMLEDFKRAGQLLSSFAYYLYFKSSLKKRAFDPTNILIFFIFSQLFLIFFFYNNPDGFSVLRIKMAPATAGTVEHIYKHFRYTYFFSDPNTVAYFSLVCAFFVLHTHSSIILKWCMLLISCLIIVATNSRGAVLCMAALISLSLYRVFRGRISVSLTLLKKNICGIFVLVMVFTIFAATDTGKMSFETMEAVYTLFEQRSGAAEYYESGGETRLDIWHNIVSTYVPSFFGWGYSFLGTPHTDHLRMIYSYGIVAYGILLYLVFRFILVPGFEFLIPAFMAFSINSLIDEQKFFALVLSLVAVAQVTVGDSNRMKHIINNSLFVPPIFKNEGANTNQIVK
ncbi:MAG: O-antigen ligase family protein [Deltaproteobacteria bacterium]|nr:O-antigen ligase family protein [Deltaproteobacteria bacterium]